TRRSLGPPLTHGNGVKAIAFSPDGQHVLTGDTDGLAWLWNAPPPAVAGDLERIKLWVQVVTGQELTDNDDQVRLLAFPTWDARPGRLAELGGPALPLGP